MAGHETRYAAKHLQGAVRMRLSRNEGDTRLHGSKKKATLRLNQSWVQLPLSGRVPGRPGDFYRADETTSRSADLVGPNDNLLERR
jgi:hypothetical protein